MLSYKPIRDGKVTFTVEPHEKVACDLIRKNIVE